jgi:hypothetical protein
MKKDERYSKEDVLADYIAETKGSHCEWALKCLAAQFLYSVNVIGQIFFTDCFLGWEFSKYGFQAASFIDLDVGIFTIFGEGCSIYYNVINIYLNLSSSKN